MSKAGLSRPTEQKDRRRSKRYRLDLPIRFRIHIPSVSAGSSPLLTARLYDLSDLGAGLLTNTMEYEGFSIMDPSRGTSRPCSLEIEFPFPYKEEPLLLKAEAVWYMRNAEGHPFAFRIGVQFLDLTPDLKKAIQSLIRLYHSGAGES